MYTNGEYSVRNKRHKNKPACWDTGVVELVLKIFIYMKAAEHDKRPTYCVVRRVCMHPNIHHPKENSIHSACSRDDLFSLFSCYYRWSWVTRELQTLMHTLPCQAIYRRCKCECVCVRGYAVRVMHAKQDHLIKYIFELSFPHPHCRITVSNVWNE